MFFKWNKVTSKIEFYRAGFFKIHHFPFLDDIYKINSYLFIYFNHVLALCKNSILNIYYLVTDRLNRSSFYCLGFFSKIFWGKYNEHILYFKFSLGFFSFFFILLWWNFDKWADFLIKTFSVVVKINCTLWIRLFWKIMESGFHQILWLKLFVEVYGIFDFFCVQ